MSSKTSTTLQKQIIKDFGEPYKAFKDQSFIDGKWYAVQHFSRAGGYWVRENAFKAAGVDYKKDFADWDKRPRGAPEGVRPREGVLGLGHDRQPLR